MTSPTDELTQLRGEIDRIDADMHALLMERGRIIDRLIAAKSGATGSAFRPAREAAMMRALAERHRGGLPIETVEGIWRVIVSTFTHLQAPFAVHGDVGAGDAAMRDAARFHFGFVVPFRAQPDAASVIEAVAASRGDLGLVAIGCGGGPWWRGLEHPEAPKVILRLPFSDRPSHPAPLPVLVVSKEPSPEGPGPVALYSVSGPGAELGPEFDILAEAGGSRLVAASVLSPDELTRVLASASAVPVGSYPARP